MNKIKLEISVQEAADHLGVTTRTVLNYIRQKEIEAIKVGKNWFIKSPSLDALVSRYGFKKPHTQAPEEMGEVADTHKIKPITGITEGKRKKTQSLATLRLFEVVKLSLLDTNLEKDNQTFLLDHFNHLKLEAIEYLGAGFYAFEFQHKKNYYNLSRQKISGMLSLLHSFEPENARIKILEDDLMPAYSALIKKLEKYNEKKKYETSKSIR